MSDVFSTVMAYAIIGMSFLLSWKNVSAIRLIRRGVDRRHRLPVHFLSVMCGVFAALVFSVFLVAGHGFAAEPLPPWVGRMVVIGLVGALIIASE